MQRGGFFFFFYCNFFSPRYLFSISGIPYLEWDTKAGLGAIFKQWGIWSRVSDGCILPGEADPGSLVESDGPGRKLPRVVVGGKLRPWRCGNSTWMAVGTRCLDAHGAGATPPMGNDCCIYVRH